ncbi:DUF1307 domain-containing protein [Shigella flexneri]
MTYVYKGDKVLKQSSETKTEFASIGATAKKILPGRLTTVKRQIQKHRGAEEKLTYTDTYAQENVTIDMEKVDLTTYGSSEIDVSAEDAKKGLALANGTGDESRWF